MRFKHWKIATLGLPGALLVLGLACGGGGDSDVDNGGDDVQVVVVTPTGPVTARPRRTPTPSPVATPTPLVVCAPNSDLAPPALLQVEEPVAGQQVRLPVHVRGWGSGIGENNKGVTLAIVDQRQNVVQVNNLPPLPREYRVPPKGMTVTDFTRPFAADVVLPNVTEPTPFCLWVYLGTTETGRAEQVVQVPVVILPAVP